MGQITEKIIIRNFGDIVEESKGTITKEEIRNIQVNGIVDTGATYVSISKKNIETLGLLFQSKVNIKTANGSTTRRTFKGAEIEMKGRTFTMDVMENDDNTPALIGYLLLEALDFAVNPKTEKVIPNPKSEDGKWYVDCY